MDNDNGTHQGQAPGAWTVTIAGNERYDGEGPYIWVVDAPDAATAAMMAERHHQSSQDDTDTVVRSVEPGAPDVDYPWAYNDLRGIPSRIVLLTPAHIRQLARIRLTYKRLDRYMAATGRNPGGACTDSEARTIEDMNRRIAGLVRVLVDELRYRV